MNISSVKYFENETLIPRIRVIVDSSLEEIQDEIVIFGLKELENKVGKQVISSIKDAKRLE